MDKYQHIPDRNQNFWQLACIQSTAQGLPAVLNGGQLARDYGNGTALISVFVGNLVLWIIALSIISMTGKDRSHAIENVKSYLGKTTAIISAIVLMTAFLTWYLLQIKASTDAIGILFHGNEMWEQDLHIRLGAGLGLLIALIACGGMRIIRRFCVAVFPFLIAYLVYAIARSGQTVTFSGTWGFSFPAIISTIAIVLPGIINLPTFFRHSRSKADSFLALILMTIFVSLFQISTIFIGISDPNEIFNGRTEVGSNIIFLASTTAFIVTSLICVNLVNIYFASAGWETIIPHRWSSKEYTIVGLLGTAAFTFIQVTAPMKFLENMAGNFIASLGITLLMVFLIKIIVLHRPRPFEKIISSSCWFIGCIASTVVQTQTSYGPNVALLTGVCASFLAFLSVIFIEELVWSLKRLSVGRSAS